MVSTPIERFKNALKAGNTKELNELLESLKAEFEKYKGLPQTRNLIVNGIRPDINVDCMRQDLEVVFKYTIKALTKASELQKINNYVKKSWIFVLG